MAGTLQTFSLNNLRGADRGHGVALQLATDINACITDLEVLRVGLAALEDWILEVDVDLTATTLGTVTSAVTTADLVDAAGEGFDLTVTGAVLGDIAIGSTTTDMIDMYTTVYIDAADSGRRWHQNEAGANRNAANDGTHVIAAYDSAVSAITGTISAGVLSASNFDAAGDMIGFNITIT